MKTQKFGIEIELTGITRKKAADVIAEYFGTEKFYIGTYYQTYGAKDRKGRTWKATFDSSIIAQRKKVIWDYDIEEIAQTLRANGITEFTISSTFSSLIETLAAFEKQGISMAGLTTVKARYTDWKTGEHALIPAIKMTVKEA